MDLYRICTATGATPAYQGYINRFIHIYTTFIHIHMHTCISTG